MIGKTSRSAGAITGRLGRLRAPQRALPRQFLRWQGAPLPRLGHRHRVRPIVLSSLRSTNSAPQRSRDDDAFLQECRRAGADSHRLLILECSPRFLRTRALKGHDHTSRLDEIDVIVVTAPSRPSWRGNGNSRGPRHRRIRSHLHQGRLDPTDGNWRGVDPGGPGPGPGARRR